MTDEKLFGPEMKPWESPKDGRLSPSSYAASAVFGLTELAFETLAGNGVPTTSANVGRLVKVFARVTIRAHRELGSGGGWASALHTRLRGALHTALVLHPYDGADLDVWEQNLYADIVAIARTAAWLYSLTPDQLEAK